MSEKLKQILTLVDEFAKEKIEKEKTWIGYLIPAQYFQVKNTWRQLRFYWMDG